MRERPPGPTFAGMNKLAIVAMSFVLMSAGAVLLPPGVPDAHAAADWSWPVRGPVITAYRNGDDPYAAGQHRGIDISAPVGASVVAAAPGTVVFAGVVGTSGLTVAERTDDGRYELSYLHLSAASVRAGEHLGQGEHLGAVGTSGRRSAQEPHLHFGVREAGDRHAYRDPLEFLGPAPTRGPDPRPVPAPVPAPAPADPAPMPVPGGAGAAAAPAGGPAGAGAAAGNAAAPIRLRTRSLCRGPRAVRATPRIMQRVSAETPRGRARGSRLVPPLLGTGRHRTRWCVRTCRLEVTARPIRMRRRRRCMARTARHHRCGHSWSAWLGRRPLTPWRVTASTSAGLLPVSGLWPPRRCSHGHGAGA